MNKKLLEAAANQVGLFDHLVEDGKIVDYNITSIDLSLDESGQVVGTIDVSIQPVVAVDYITIKSTVSRYEAAAVELQEQKYYTTTTYGELGKVFNYDAELGSFYGD